MMQSIREKTISGLQIGDTFTVSRRITESDVISFAHLSRDYNPIHFDERFTTEKGFHGKACHGLLVGSLLTEIGGQIGWLASGMNFRFKKPVYFGETVTCTFTLTRLAENGKARAEVVFRNEAGEVVVTAELFGQVPVGKDREIMRQMVEAGDPTNPIS
jgi:3-hydroxybutyryl-CoA dehydratase